MWLNHPFRQNHKTFLTFKGHPPMSHIMVHWRYRSFSYNHDLLWKNSCWNKTPPNFFPCWIVLGHFQPFMILWKVIWTLPYLNQYTKSVFQNIPFVCWLWIRWGKLHLYKANQKIRRNPGSKTNLNLAHWISLWVMSILWTEFHHLFHAVLGHFSTPKSSRLFLDRQILEFFWPASKVASINTVLAHFQRTLNQAFEETNTTLLKMACHLPPSFQDQAS